MNLIQMRLAIMQIASQHLTGKEATTKELFTAYDEILAKLTEDLEKEPAQPEDVIKPIGKA